MQLRPRVPPQGAAAPVGAANPALVLSDEGPDLLDALAAAGFATRLARTPAELYELLSGLRGIATPPLVLIDLRRGVPARSVQALRQLDGRLPILAVADDPDLARAAAEAGANATVATAELGPRLAELVNMLVRMATLW